MPVIRYRSVEEMPGPWRDARDPENLRLTARMLAFYRSLVAGPRRAAGVRLFRTIEEANADRNDPYRR